MYDGNAPVRALAAEDLEKIYAQNIAGQLRTSLADLDTILAGGLYAGSRHRTKASRLEAIDEHADRFLSTIRIAAEHGFMDGTQASAALRDYAARLGGAPFLRETRIRSTLLLIADAYAQPPGSGTAASAEPSRARAALYACRIMPDTGENYFQPRRYKLARTNSPVAPQPDAPSTAPTTSQSPEPDFIEQVTTLLSRSGYATVVEALEPETWNPASFVMRIPAQGTPPPMPESPELTLREHVRQAAHRILPDLEAMIHSYAPVWY